ncbi:class I SAM-dependent methyltransferase [Mycobacterium sp.]|uniref:class I SAM-dependent methyltransferase n=1 Tax=Mycobacterium sp. TaxID=1785 RepID=UPI003BAB2CCB
MLVFKGSAPLAWRCPANNLIELYKRSLGARHLELGVGTGYLMARSRFPVANPNITLVDMNEMTLDYTAQRMRNFNCTKVIGDALQPLPVPEDSHDSAALSLLLHCIPGTLLEKGVAIKHAAAAVRPGGIVFGGTVLSSGVPVSAVGRWLMNNLNKKGVFHNEQDSFEDLRTVLEQNFDDYEIYNRGCVGLFRARKPEHAAPEIPTESTDEIK